MFSVRQKREIADSVQKVLRSTNHPELPTGKITFLLQVKGSTSMSWANIRNNGAIIEPSVNPHNEAQDPPKRKKWKPKDTPLKPFNGYGYK